MKNKEELPRWTMRVGEYFAYQTVVSKGRKSKRGHILRTKNLLNMTQNGVKDVAEEMI